MVIRATQWGRCTCWIVVRLQDEVEARAKLDAIMGLLCFSYSDFKAIRAESFAPVMPPTSARQLQQTTAMLAQPEAQRR